MKNIGSAHKVVWWGGEVSWGVIILRERAAFYNK